jgi:hypothetical protein
MREMTLTFSRTNSAANSVKRSLRPSAQRYSIATLRPSVQPSSRSCCTKVAVQTLCGSRTGPEQPNGRQLSPLLRPRRERPRRGGAKQRDELAPPHSITSSAMASSLSGIVNPSALAVLTLITSSTFTACWTGRSAGFAPLRILPV